MSGHPGVGSSTGDVRGSGGTYLDVVVVSSETDFGGESGLFCVGEVGTGLDQQPHYLTAPGLHRTQQGRVPVHVLQMDTGPVLHQESRTR